MTLCRIVITGAVCECHPCDIELGVLMLDLNMYPRNVIKKNREMRWYSGQGMKPCKSSKISLSVCSYQHCTEHDWSSECWPKMVQVGLWCISATWSPLPAWAAHYPGPALCTPHHLLGLPFPHKGGVYTLLIYICTKHGFCDLSSHMPPHGG